MLKRFQMASIVPYCPFKIQENYWHHNDHDLHVTVPKLNWYSSSAKQHLTSYYCSYVMYFQFHSELAALFMLLYKATFKYHVHNSYILSYVHAFNVLCTYIHSIILYVLCSYNYNCCYNIMQFHSHTQLNIYSDY